MKLKVSSRREERARATIYTVAVREFPLSAAWILIHLSSRYENGTNLVAISRRHFILIRLRFRKFLRSGTTISIVMILGVSHNLVEEFSFALAVALTPGSLPSSVHP